MRAKYVLADGKAIRYGVAVAEEALVAKVGRGATPEIKKRLHVMLGPPIRL